MTFGRLPLAPLALLVSAVIFGSAAVPAKTALERVPPFVLAEARWVIATSILLLLLRRRGLRPELTRTTWLLGLTGLALFYLFYSFGLRRTTAANATLIGGVTPVVVAILSRFLLGERIGRRTVLGIALSLIGVAIIVGRATGLGVSLDGNLLILGSCASWAVYTVLGRRSYLRGDPLAILTGTAVAALVIMAPLAAYELARPGLGDVRPRDLLLVAYLGLGPSALAYLLNTYGLARVEASRAAIYGNVMPIAGAVAGALFLDEHLGWPHLLGGACVILGAWYASSRGSSRASSDETT